VSLVKLTEGEERVTRIWACAGGPRPEAWAAGRYSQGPAALAAPGPESNKEIFLRNGRIR